MEEQAVYCVFCDIIAGREPGVILYQDEDIVVIRNRLHWTPVMLLAIPRQHMSQEEMWQHPLLHRIGQVAVQMGQKYCPDGYRLLSNFGMDAMQSQEHGHLHVIGGTYLGPYA